MVPHNQQSLFQKVHPLLEWGREEQEGSFDLVFLPLDTHGRYDNDEQHQL